MRLATASCRTCFFGLKWARYTWTCLLCPSIAFNCFLPDLIRRHTLLVSLCTYLLILIVHVRRFHFFFFSHLRCTMFCSYGMVYHAYTPGMIYIYTCHSIMDTDGYSSDLSRPNTKITACRAIGSSKMVGGRQKEHYWRARRSEWSLWCLNPHEIKLIQILKAACSRCQAK